MVGNGREGMLEVFTPAKPHRSSGRTAVALLLVLLTCACSGSGAPKDRAASPKAASHSASPVPARGVAAPASPADLKLAGSLAKVGDLPAGYTRDVVTRGTALAVSVGDSPCAKRFSALNRLRTVGPLATTATAKSSFSRGAAGPFIRTTARRYRTPAAAAKVLKAVDAVFRTCPSFTATNPGTKRVTTVTLTPLTFPHLGNEGVAVAGRLVSGGKGVDVNLVFVRAAASVASVAQITAGAADAPALQRAVRAEVSRLTAGT